MLKRFLVAIDGSTRAQRGLKAAFDLAPDLRPTPSGVYVIDETAALPPIDSGFVPADYLEDMIDSLRDAGARMAAPRSEAVCQAAAVNDNGWPNWEPAPQRASNSSRARDTCRCHDGDHSEKSLTCFQIGL